MDLFNPKDLAGLCERYKLNPSKKYGQNYLISSKVIEEIIKTADLSEKDTVVEVGPGFGVLTLALAKRAGRVVSFEIEKKLEDYWREKQAEYPNVEIVWGNVLNVFKDWENKLPKNYSVAANLPYQITSGIIRLFLESKNPPSEMILMVQKEVAQRIAAKPGQMSLLSLSVQFYAKPKIIVNVPRTKFWPSPKVDSAVIALEIKKTPADVDAKKFFRLAKIGFANKRKMLFNNFVGTFGKNKKDEILKVFEKTLISPTARAQDLSLEEWTKLSENLKS